MPLQPEQFATIRTIPNRRGDVFFSSDNTASVGGKGHKSVLCIPARMEGEKFPTCVDVPDLGGLIEATAENSLAVRGKGDRYNVFFMASKCPDILVYLALPIGPLKAAMRRTPCFLKQLSQTVDITFFPGLPRQVHFGDVKGVRVLLTGATDAKERNR